MTTFADFLAQTRRTLGEPVEGVWTDESLTWWTNEAATDIAREAKPLRDITETTSVAGVNAYLQPDASLEPLSVYFAGVRLARTAVENALTVAAMETRGTPLSYAFAESTLYLIPAPSTADIIRLVRYRRPAPIALPSDIMPFRSDYDGALMLFVLQRAFEQVADWQSAGEYAARYTAALGNAVAQETRERSFPAAPTEVF